MREPIRTQIWLLNYYYELDYSDILSALQKSNNPDWEKNEHISKSDVVKVVELEDWTPEEDGTYLTKPIVEKDSIQYNPEKIRDAIAEFYIDAYPYGNFHSVDKEEFQNTPILIESEVMYLTLNKASFNPLNIEEFENKTIEDHGLQPTDFREFNGLFGY